ncbi:hypothetical protein A9G42_00740 [Gilliamella sp. Nev6-6]|uniref:hypothetical protein n=1 Tax=Gilliamella sp. Nev6-6 TaxID=3120252 RepID=UPI00080F4596|nr:hypothetical protein [Gilliamella apicola]OCG78664.1 hypothetical protein A9G42_00740 [Gilliamella apicola]
MVVNIILQETINEQDFILLANKWQQNASVIIESLLENNEAKNRIFNLALNYIPNSFAEAVIDIFLEDSTFIIRDDDLLKCAKQGSMGLKKSICYRKNVPQYIIDLCNLD